MPRIKDDLAAPEPALMLADHRPVLFDDDPVRIGMSIDWPSYGVGQH
jgi:hypothetical protein